MIGQTVVFEFIETTSQAEELAAVLERLKNQAGDRCPPCKKPNASMGTCPLKSCNGLPKNWQFHWRDYTVPQPFIPSSPLCQRGVHH